MNNSQEHALLERIAELEKRIEKLEAENAELKSRLLAYENAHTPPSMRRHWRKPPTGSNGSIGAPRGHSGATRPEPEPDEIVDVKPLQRCPNCDAKLGKPDWIEKKLIEDIPEPQPITVTQFNLPHHTCQKCGLQLTAAHPGCPENGRFGFNTLTHVTLLKYDGRLPHRKIAEALEREFGLSITAATVLDINRRVSDALQPEYNKIVNRVRASLHVYVDETGLRVAGQGYWTWIFVTESDVLAVIRPSRGRKVLEEILGKDYAGIIISDGLKSYSNFTGELQRCWAHLLREAKFIAENIGEAAAFSNALHKLYKRLTAEYRKQLTIGQRQHLWKNAIAVLRYWLRKPFRHERLKQFAEKLRNGFRHWFTFILHPEIEPTNNIAERALREHVVQRKIFGCLRNHKGTHMHETVMSLLATWKLHGLNPQAEMLKALRS